MALPRASLIVSTWNGRHLLEQCLPPLLRAAAEAGGEHEVIVVDDASTDDTVEFVRREYPNLTLLPLPHNLRFAGANNAAARAASGEVLVFLNNDMLVEPGFLAPLLQHFSDPEVFAVTAHLQMAPRMTALGRVRETGLVRGRFEQGFLTLHHEDPEDGAARPVIYVGGGSSAWRRDQFLALGGFDRLFHPFYFEDLDVSYRAQKHGWRLLFEPGSRMEHKHQQTNNASNFAPGFVEVAFIKNNLLFLWKVLTDGDLVNAHFRGVGRRLLHARTDPVFARGFRRAFRQLPALLFHRHRARAGVVLTDREVIARAAGPAHVPVAETGAPLPYGSAGLGKRVLVLGVDPLPFETAGRVTPRGVRTWQVVRALLADGHEVTLAARREPGAWEEEAARPPVLHAQGEHFAYWSLAREAFEGSDVLTRVATQARPEAIVAVGAQAAWAASRLDTEAPRWADLFEHEPTAAQARAAAGETGAVAEAQRWEKAALTRADAISVSTTRQKLAVIGELAAAGRLTATSYGDDLVQYLPAAVDEFSPRPTPSVLRGQGVGENDFVILWTGDYDARTDVDTLLAGLLAVMREHVDVHFVSLGTATPGAEETLVRFRQGVEESDYGSRFHFLGTVAEAELPAHYRESSVGLNVERYSYDLLLGCRYRVLDMLRCGLPVVMTAGSELSQTVRTEHLGETVAPGDVGGLARALEEFLRDEARRRRAGGRAREWAHKHRLVGPAMAPLLKWVQAPTKTESATPPRAPEAGWQPRSTLGRLARKLETVGLVPLLRGAAKACVTGVADVALRAVLRRRAVEPWGIDPTEPPHRALVIRAGSLALTGAVVARLRERFPVTELTVLAPEQLLDETRYQTEAPVLAAPGAGLVSYRVTRPLLRELREGRYDTMIVAGEGNRRAELLAALGGQARKVEVREDGAAHVFTLAPHRPLLALGLGVVRAAEVVGLGLLLLVAWAGVRGEGLLWRVRQQVSRAARRR